MESTKETTSAALSRKHPGSGSRARIIFLPAPAAVSKILEHHEKIVSDQGKIIPGNSMTQTDWYSGNGAGNRRWQPQLQQPDQIPGVFHPLLASPVRQICLLFHPLPVEPTVGKTIQGGDEASLVVAASRKASAEVAVAWRAAKADRRRPTGKA